VTRYASADELRADLLRFLAGRPVAAEAAPERPPPESTSVMAAADRTQAIPAATAMGDDGGPKRRTSAYVVLLVVLLALLAGGLFLLGRELGLGTSGAAQVVPNAIGKTQDEATKLLTDAGFHPKIQKREDNATAATVIDQNPKPEAKASKGSDVTLIVSSGPPQVTVPDEKGKDQDTARNDLEAQQFVVSTRAQQSDRPQNEVLDQNPQAGSRVDRGSTVTLTVSSGTGQIAVPNVVGRDSADAANILGQAGFKTTTKTSPSDTVDAGKVIGTTPGPGAKAAKGSTVTMVVSSGPSPSTTASTLQTTTTQANTATVPDVVGDHESVAAAKIQGRGFALSASNCTSDSIVTRQDPAGGTSAPRGSTVSISCV
jgi:beta-lactam-binding protein with PASTA domain